MTEDVTYNCDCPKCVRCCENTPGWFTPAEARRAIEAGYADRMMLDYLYPDRTLGNVDDVLALSPAIRGYENQRAPTWFRGHCTFLKSGRCEIHDSGFKPYECRNTRACDKTGDHINHIFMARFWYTDEGREVVRLWFQQFHQAQPEASSSR